MKKLLLLLSFTPFVSLHAQVITPDEEEDDAVYIESSDPSAPDTIRVVEYVTPSGQTYTRPAARPEQPSGVVAEPADSLAPVPAGVEGLPDGIDPIEGMVQNVDSLLMEWAAKQYLTPDPSCPEPSERPSYTDEDIMSRLRRLPVVIEMPYNEVVRKYIDSYVGPGAKMVSYLLGAGNFYMPIFEEALDHYGLPLELKYLPVIESALKPTAKSPSGAVGLWQMVPSAAGQYGLERNSLIDERRDTYKASYAAAQLLSDLFKIYGDWSLAIAAYNCGPGNVNKAIHRAGGARDYWTIYPYLPRETRGYVPAFIAANYAMNYYCEHNICPMVTAYPVTTDTVMVSRNVHFRQIAEVCDVDIEAVRALNPQYLTDLIPGEVHPCALCLPSDKLMQFIDLEDSVYVHRADELLTRRAVVAPAAGDVKTTVTRQTTTAKKKTTARKPAAKTVTVKKGDTLSHIARRNGTTVAKLRKLNGIKGDNLRAGQKVRVR